jgi:hypothetical protein
MTDIYKDNFDGTAVKVDGVTIPYDAAATYLVALAIMHLAEVIEKKGPQANDEPRPDFTGFPRIGPLEDR